MKVKTVIISAAVGAVIVLGTAYGIGSSMKKKAQPVEVVPVPNVNEGSDMGMMTSSTLYGNIVSRDTQNVQLDTSHAVKAVYVQEGDKVKKGDKLMEYDMELTGLKREAEDLTRQGLELSLQNMQKDLATMQSGKLPANYGSDDDQFFGGGGAAEDIGSDDTGSDDADEDSVDDEDSDYTTSGDVLISEPSDSGTADGQTLEDSTGSDTGSAEEEGSQSADSGQDDSSQQIVADSSPSLISGSDDTQIIMDDAGDDYGLSDDGTVSDDSSLTLDADEETLGYVNTFLNDVNTLTGIANNGFDSLASGEAGSVFTEAFDIFRSHLSEAGETAIADFFGESRAVYTYAVSGRVTAMVGDTTAGVLQQAYDRLCVYQFINSVRQIFPGRMDASDVYSYEQIKAAEVQVRAAADAFYQLQNGIYSISNDGVITFSTEFSALNQAFGGGQSYADYLYGLILKLNSTAQTIFPYNWQETEIPPMTETPDPHGGGGGGGDDGPTAKELAEAIEQQKKNIVECQLQIRESKLAIKDYDRTLANETVRATLDGIVKQAGTTTEQPSSGAFIVITGKAGMYVQGTLSERSLDTLKVGDTITGTSWNTGSMFTARITEISEYPSDSGGNSFYYDSSEDQNSSQYPFLAYIENADGLSSGDGVELNVDSTVTSGGLSVAAYLVRTDASGKRYCYVRGTDGNLEKRYVEAKDDGSGYSVRILKGLRAKDFIAFPYGDDVKEGAPTEIVSTLTAVSGSYY